MPDMTALKEALQALFEDVTPGKSAEQAAEAMAESFGEWFASAQGVLLRAPGDFSTFPEKVAPAAGDFFLLEDSADGGAKKRARTSAISGSGPAGADGKTILNGTAAPVGGLGTEGDFYLNTLTNRLYGPKTAGAWGAGVTLVGPQGATGTAGTNGTNGTNGAAGATGAAGSNGVDGKTVRSGSGVPSGGLGVDGDFYINTAANTLYGPKTAGAWGSSTSLVGPAGTAGTNGTNGTNGAAGAAGPSNVIQESGGPTTLTVGAIPDGTFGKRVGSAFVGVAVAANYSQRNQYRNAPDTPNAYDDYFDSGSADLAVRGWTVINRNGGSAVTWSGNGISLTGAGPAANTYNAEIIDSRLRIQAAGAILIYKSTSINGFTYAHKVNFGANRINGVASNLWYANNLCRTIAAGPGAVFPATSDWVVGGPGFDADTQLMVNRYWSGSWSSISIAGAQSASATIDAGAMDYVFVNGFSGSQPAIAAIVMPLSRSIITCAVNTGNNLYGTCALNLNFNSGSAYSGDKPNPWMEIDYMRRFPVAQWFPEA